MALLIDIPKLKARTRLEEAIEIACSAKSLPDEWIRNVTEVGASSRKVDIAVLGCALLAKSCDARIDPLVVKKGVSERGYHMRGIAEGVLLPARHRYGIDIGSTSSKNPVNSSTWLKPRTLEDVITRDRKSYARLLGILREVDVLDEQEALYALAAWVRVRMAVTAAKRTVRVTTTGADFAALLAACRTFVLENPERGARGQALVAAAFDLVWGTVRTGKVTDPSRHWPGDVHAFDTMTNIPVAAAEVKQRTVTEGEVHDFIGACVEVGIGNVFYVTLHEKQKVAGSLPPQLIADRNGCNFTWLHGVDTVVSAAFAWSANSLDANILTFTQRMMQRLEDVELLGATQDRWAELTHSTTVG